MFAKHTINNYFQMIKKNHKHYLETQMVTHLGIMGLEHKKELLDCYIKYIKNYRELKKDDLNDDIRGTSIAETLERGSVSALLGTLIGGLIFVLEQRTPSVDLFGAKTAVQGGFAAALGASSGALIYSAWDKSQEKPAHADLNVCEAQMKKAGFTDERYATLSAELVKLFHFRESLLLGLVDNNKTNMREAFKHRYYSNDNANHFDENDFNQAIDVYFLEQFNTLFQQAFKTIHLIHDSEISAEQQSNEFYKWFKRYFESTDNRQKFTQQMQVQFIKNCIQYLEQQMHQPGFLGQYLYLMDISAGLITASFVVGILAANVWFLPVIALVSIGVAAATLGGLCAHLIIIQDVVFYKRDKNNRNTIQSAINSIAMEQTRLATLLQTVVVTTNKDLAELKKYDQDDKSDFLKILSGNPRARIARGSVRAWIREFAARFNESKLVEIDLSERIQKLINNSHDQTTFLQKQLALYMLDKESIINIKQCIDHTINYLKSPENSAFIKTFESVQKIREQLLDIVSYIPLDRKKSLPECLVTFYITPITKGGLGGLCSDLEQIRRIAPAIPTDTQANHSHPYQQLLDTAFTIQLKLNESDNAAFILSGDNEYRSILGLPLNQTMRIEDKINASNIQRYLNESFNFLCGLNQYETTIAWEDAFQNIDPFILYRMLLTKQLAVLAAPNNVRVDSLVKDEIKHFARSKLNYNPDVAFDDILNQALLVSSEDNLNYLTDKLGNRHLINELANIADAIRVDMAYVSTSLSPKQLITLKAQECLIQNNDKVIFGVNSIGQLIPELSRNFFDKINESITITSTFITTITTDTLLQQTHSARLYLQEVANEIYRIEQEIMTLKSLLTHPEQPVLEDAINALSMFKQNLDLPEPMLHTQDRQSDSSEPTQQSIGIKQDKHLRLFSMLPRLFSAHPHRLSINNEEGKKAPQYNENG